MADFSTRARSVAHPFSSPDYSEQLLRSLKARLHARFPAVKSSHVAEALAAAQGFNTYAALRADMVNPLNWPLGKPFDIERFRQRLMQLGYPIQADFTFGPAPIWPAPSTRYLDRLEELRELLKHPDRVYPRIRSLQLECAREFADTFGLGTPGNGDARPAVKRWYVGVDHAGCLPRWGDTINHRVGGSVSFPGTDHRRDFFQRLPLSDGRYAEYQSAMVSMPYTDVPSQPPQLADAAAMAGLLGWTCTVLPEWSWYMPGASTLVLFRPVSSNDQMLAAWENSFKRWMLENMLGLKRSAGSTRRKVIADIVDCQHLPLDVGDFEDCRERYLKEFAAHLYYDGDAGMAKVFERLMLMWETQLG